MSLDKRRMRYYYDRYFMEFPIGFQERTNLTLERAKMRLVAHALVFMYSGNGIHNEENVLKVMCDIRDLDYGSIPDLYKACQETRVRMDFIQDYSKLAYLEQANPCIGQFMNLLLSSPNGHMCYL